MNRLLTLVFLCFSSLLIAQGENLFSDASLHEIRIEGADTTFNFSDRDYQQVTIIIDGERLDSVGIRLKGNISVSHENLKVPLKVKTNKYVRGRKIDGIKEFTLHNNYQDPSMLREKITYDLVGELGLHALRAAFTRVYINNVYWGLYTIVEAKDELYERVFDNNDGAVLETFEGGNMCYIGPDQNDYSHDIFGPRYVLDNGVEDTAWTYFPLMLEIANNTPANSYMDVVPRFLNVSDWFTYQAMNAYLMNADSYLVFSGNQLYYFNEVTRLWEVIPWDFNASLDLWDTNNSSPQDFPLVPQGMNGCIARRMGEVPELMNIYHRTICTLVNDLADTTRMIARIDELREQIDQAVYDDRRKEFTNAEFDRATEYGYFDIRPGVNFLENVPALKTFFVDRFNFINAELTAANINCEVLPTYEPLDYTAFVIAPNPVSDMVTIKMTSADEGFQRVELYSIEGRLLDSRSEGTFSSISLPLTHLPQGMYLVRVYSREGKIGTRKLVKR